MDKRPFSQRDSNLRLQQSNRRMPTPQTAEPSGSALFLSYFFHFFYFSLSSFPYTFIVLFFYFLTSLSYVIYPLFLCVFFLILFCFVKDMPESGPQCVVSITLICIYEWESVTTSSTVVTLTSRETDCPKDLLPRLRQPPVLCELTGSHVIFAARFSQSKLQVHPFPFRSLSPISLVHFWHDACSLSPSLGDRCRPHISSTIFLNGYRLKLVPQVYTLSCL